MHWSLEFAMLRHRKLSPGESNRRYRSTLMPLGARSLAQRHVTPSIESETRSPPTAGDAGSCEAERVEQTWWPSKARSACLRQLGRFPLDI